MENEGARFNGCEVGFLSDRHWSEGAKVEICSFPSLECEGGLRGVI